MPPKASGINNKIIRQLEEKFETDRYGIDSMTLRIEIPDKLFPKQLIRNDQTHPRFFGMLLTKRSGSKATPGFWSVTYTFEGFMDALPDPYYELQAGLDQEPIQCHPKFISHIAGTPASPLNGAVFIAPATGLPTSDNDAGVFREFAATIGGELNPKGGIESYFVPGAEWRVIEFSTTRPPEFRNLGTIDGPTGPNPTLSGRNWLLFSHTYLKRGGVYQSTTTWKLSGKNGWDSDIYSD